MKEKLPFLRITMDCVSVLGLIITLLPETSQEIKYICLGLVILLLLGSIIFSFLNTKNCRRRKLIQTGKTIITNIQHSIVLFGGDLSWTKDYYEVLKNVLKDGKIVEVYFPQDKYCSLTKDSKTSLKKQVTDLKDIGAKVYYFKQDIGLRCIFADPNIANGNDDLTIFSAKRIRRNAKNGEKDKYSFNIFQYSKDNEKDICKSYLGNYLLIKEQRKEWEDEL